MVISLEDTNTTILDKNNQEWDNQKVHPREIICFMSGEDEFENYRSSLKIGFVWKLFICVSKTKREKTENQK